MSSDTEAPVESEAYRKARDELVRRILDGDVDREEVETAKLEVCGTYGAPKVPTNAELIRAGPDDRREELEAVLRRKPVRTASGVTPVAIMTSPHLCPHGKCLYCPGGPASEFSSAQSYTGHEPAAARGDQTDYDPYAQVTLRLAQLREIGHPVDKVELILMGGTMTARSADYQAWFVRRALAAMNDFDPEDPPRAAAVVDGAAGTGAGPRYLEDVKARNERGSVRNVATTFETKPDWCGPAQVDRMLRLGGTKVEVGVQTTYERINREMHRGHGTDASVAATRRLREAGFKVGYHMMPGQPGMSVGMCREDFRRLFADGRWRPDYLKIYPTLVVEGTRVYDQWRRGDFEPLSSAEAAELVASIKRELPPYVRLQRVQRDIPADFIEAGVQKSNLRQLARQRMAERGWTCDCIRCREVGHHDATPVDPTMETLTYTASGGEEHFISIEDRSTTPNVLVGFARLRFPVAPRRDALQNAAILRELHVYGSELGVGERDADGSHQHQGHGRRLMAEAERRAAAAGYDTLAVIAGIGARAYYREQLGYRQDGPYVTTALDGG
ncbi:MAG: tRNA uridine(34) 5-carboxymethylaminomethyl modification radical SAM/GNAT enzyme Elp3 [Halobacteriaceae archaeon]